MVLRCCACLLALCAWRAAADPVTLYVIGDSTAAIQPKATYPLTGWAQTLQDCFVVNKVVVDNRALNGRSAKSFYEDGAWAAVMERLKKGDYVFIQFGHNDATKTDPKRYTEPQSTYKEFLKRYVTESRGRGATPVILTSINRNTWNADGTLLDTMGGYPAAARELAKELEAPLLDLHLKTRQLFESLGKDKTTALFMKLEKGQYPGFPDGRDDNTHLQETGAKAVAKLAVDGIRELKLPIGAYVISPTAAR